MRDFQFWIYIVIGAVYLLSRFFKKPAQNSPDPPKYKPEKPATRFDQPPPVKPSASPSKMLTFEELLREITESKTQAKPQPPAKHVNYDEELAEEEQDLENVDYDYKKDKVAVEYEEAKQHAFSRSSLEETMNLSDIDIKFGRFKIFDQDSQTNFVDKYLTDFYDPEGLKKAIVMSEILQRKF